MCVMKMILDSPKYILGDQGQSVGSGEKARRKFQAQAEEPLGTDSHHTISKRSSECWLLIGHTKMLCIIVQVPNRRTAVTTPGCPRMTKVGRQKGTT